jgi:hypothetical protein
MIALSTAFLPLMVVATVRFWRRLRIARVS